MTTFYLIRHGDTPSVGRFLAGRAPGVHLTETGHRQAESLAVRLAGEPIRAVYASPLERARETAEPLAVRLGLEVRSAPELLEVDFGAWTGVSFADLDPQPHWQQYNTFRSGTRIPGGESMLEVQQRVIGFLQRLCGDHSGEAVTLVSHAEVIRAALLYFLGMPLDSFHRLEIRTASVSIVAVGPHGPLVQLVNGSGP